MEGGRASGRGACRGLVGEMLIAEPSSSSGSGPMKRLATNGHAYYSVARKTDAAWHDLLTRVAEEAGVAFDFVSYPLPQSLEELWTRADLGCVFMMCGYPISLRQLHVVPIAAPIPQASWARGRAVYRTDLVVKADTATNGLAIPLAVGLAGHCAIRTPAITRCDTTYCSTGRLSGRHYIHGSWETSVPYGRCSMPCWKARSTWDLSMRIGTC